MALIDPYRQREQRIRCDIEHAQRIIAWLEDKGKLDASDSLTKLFVEDLNRADLYLDGKGDVWFPKEYRLNSAERKVRSVISALEGFGWVKNEYEPDVGWRPS